MNWNGTSLVTTTMSSTQLTAIVPSSFITSPNVFPITVVSNGVTSDNSLQFIVTPAPFISSLSPSPVVSTGPGFTLTVNGSNFVLGATATWNGVSLATTFVNPTQLTAWVPAANIANSGSANITVFEEGSTSNTAVLEILPVPTATLLSPHTRVATGQDFTLTVTGTNFVNGASVLWNGVYLNTTFLDPSTLQASVPSLKIATAGSSQITVSQQGVTTSPPLLFTIYSPPTLSSISPDSVFADSVDTTINLTGTNFHPTSTVLFNGLPISTVYFSGTSLTATIPAGSLVTPGKYSVTVTEDGVISNSKTFTVEYVQVLTTTSGIFTSTSNLTSLTFAVVGGGGSGGVGSAGSGGPGGPGGGGSSGRIVWGTVQIFPGSQIQWTLGADGSASTLSYRNPSNLLQTIIASGGVSGGIGGGGSGTAGPTFPSGITWAMLGGGSGSGTGGISTAGPGVIVSNGGSQVGPTSGSGAPFPINFFPTKLVPFLPGGSAPDPGVGFGGSGGAGGAAGLGVGGDGAYNKSSARSGEFGAGGGGAAVSSAHGGPGSGGHGAIMFVLS